MDRIVDALNATAAWLPWTGEQSGVAYELAVSASATTVISGQHYHVMWDEWQRLPHVEWQEKRSVAVARLKSCLANQSDTLDLCSLGLTSLPELPPHIHMLMLGSNQLTSLPTLPGQLKELYAEHNQLVALPPFPEEMMELDVSNNKLAKLPALSRCIVLLNACNNHLASLPELPNGLEYLSVSHNQLTKLPLLPRSLSSLIIDHNLLKRLPELPHSLILLTASENQLTRLPAIPDSLGYLIVNENLLTEFPVPLSDNIKKLCFRNNKLTRLPENILSFKSRVSFRIFSPVYIDVSENPLSLQTFAFLKCCHDDPDFVGPEIVFSKAGIEEKETVRTLLSEVVTDWFPLKEKKTIFEQWRAIEHLEGDYTLDAFSLFDVSSSFYAFSAFLLRLRRTLNESEIHGFAAFVASWLNLLQAQSLLRTATIYCAKKVEKNVEINIAQIWYTMQKTAVFDTIEKQDGGDTLSSVIMIARESFRLERLESLAREHAGKLLCFSELEIYLALQTQLRTVLNLTSIPPNLFLIVPPGITPSELEGAVSQIKNEEDSQFPKWLARWFPWQQYVARIQPDMLAMMMEKRQQLIRHDHPKRLRDRLKKLGLKTNDAAAKAIDREMKQDIITQCYVELTHQVTKGAKKQFLLNPHWNNRAWWWRPWR